MKVQASRILTRLMHTDHIIRHRELISIIHLQRSLYLKVLLTLASVQRKSLRLYDYSRRLIRFLLDIMANMLYAVTFL